MEQHEELTMNTTPAFADNLALLRANHNMTQEQLAERLGVSRQSVSKWESGVCLPELATLDTLCSLFDCTLDNLLRGSVAQADLAALEAYDAGWNRFAKAITFGTAMVLLGGGGPAHRRGGRGLQPGRRRLKQQKCLPRGGRHLSLSKNLNLRL